MERDNYHPKSLEATNAKNSYLVLYEQNLQKTYAKGTGALEINLGRAPQKIKPNPSW